jgi:hypothetical protein
VWGRQYAIGDDGLLTYAYRGTDPNHRDNVGLRKAYRTRTPLIYFKEVHDHRYQAIWPVIVLEDLHGAVLHGGRALQEHGRRSHVEQCLLVEPVVDGGHASPFSHVIIVPCARDSARANHAPDGPCV